MTTQARSQGDPRWYNPDRDMIWAFPRLISRSLNSLGDVPECDHAKITTVSKELGRLIQEIRDAKLKPEEIPLRLQAMDQSALAYVHKAFFYALFAELWNWCGEVSPIPGDRLGKLDLSELEKIVESFARSSRPPAGGADAQTA